MSRKSEKFFDAITCIREDLIEEAQNFKFRKNAAVWKKYFSLAACIVLVMSIGFVAILPRGCGSSGGSDGSAAPNGAAAPQDSEVSGDTAPPLSLGGYEGASSDAPADAPEENLPEDGTGSYQFTAVVTEIREDGLLVEPIEYSSHYQVLVPLADLEVPPLAEGDWIAVTCSEVDHAADPPAAKGVVSIEKMDPGE